MKTETTQSHPPVPLLDLKRPLQAAPQLAQALKDAFSRVLESGHYILGPEVTAFESEVAAYCQVPHAIGVSSGTDALLLALMAHDIGPGDDVICPTYTFFATAGTIARTGARPVFVDACPGCFNMHPSAAQKGITPNTRAMIAVHLFGQTAHMQKLLAVAKAHNLTVIEDAAQAIGAEDAGARAGAMGHAGCFSFFPSKNLGALGDAGLVTTHDETLAERMRILRVHGGAPKYFHSAIGGNFRLDALQAAMLRIKLPYLDAASRARAAHAAQYDARFAAAGLGDSGGCCCATELPDPRAPAAAGVGLPRGARGRHIYNQYTIRVRNGRRDAVRAALQKQGIGTEIYYPVPMHLQPCFAALGYREGDLPHAELAAKEAMSLPIFPELRDEEIDRVATAVIAAC